MIYKSRDKIEEIINDKEPMFKLNSEVTVKANPCEGVTTEISIGPIVRNSLKKAISILKRKGLYNDMLQGDIKEGYYYEIIGFLSYVGLEEGMQRHHADPRFLNSMREKDFFEDDFLKFRIDMGMSNEYRFVDVKCQAKGIQCFGKQTIREYNLLSLNTSDPGILIRKILVNSLIRIENVNEYCNCIQGSPLYIKRKYE